MNTGEQAYMVAVEHIKGKPTVTVQNMGRVSASNGSNFYSGRGVFSCANLYFPSRPHADVITSPVQFLSSTFVYASEEDVQAAKLWVVNEYKCLVAIRKEELQRLLSECQEFDEHVIEELTAAMLDQ